MTSQKTRGRKPMPERERRTHTVLVRLSEAEHRAIVKAAGHEPLASWVRRAALRAAEARKRRKS